MPAPPGAARRETAVRDAAGVAARRDRGRRRRHARHGAESEGADRPDRRLAPGSRRRHGSTLEAVGRTPYQLGQTALERADQQQSLEQAISLFNKALELDPDYALAHAGLGRAYLSLYQISEAPGGRRTGGGALHRANELDRLMPHAWLTLGALHTQLGKYEQALDELNRAPTRDPRNGRLPADRVRLPAAAAPPGSRGDLPQGDLARAEVVVAHAYYGAFLALRGRYRRSRAAFRCALDIAPDNPRILSNLGGVLRNRGRQAEARAAFEKSIALYPTSGALSNSRRSNTATGGSPRPRHYERATSRPARLPDLAKPGSRLHTRGRRIGRRRPARPSARPSNLPSRNDSGTRATACSRPSWPTATPSSGRAEARRLLAEAEKLAPARSGREGGAGRGGLRGPRRPGRRAQMLGAGSRGDYPGRRWNRHRRSRSCALIPATRRSSPAWRPEEEVAA